MMNNHVVCARVGCCLINLRLNQIINIIEEAVNLEPGRLFKVDTKAQLVTYRRLRLKGRVTQNDVTQLAVVKTIMPFLKVGCPITTTNTCADKAVEAPAIF